MANGQLQVKTTLSSLSKGGKAYHQFHAILSRFIKYEQFLKIVSEAVGMDEYTLRRVWEGVGLSAARLLSKAIGINAGWMHFNLKIKGSGEYANSVPDEKANPLMVSLLAKGVLADAALSLKPVNVTETVEAILYAVEQEGAGEANLLTAAGANIVASGRNIFTEDGADTGVYLMNGAGTIAATGTISRSDSGTVEFSFAELPADGEYTLSILTRNGMSADDYGVSQVERKITVKAA